MSDLPSTVDGNMPSSAVPRDAVSVASAATTLPCYSDDSAPYLDDNADEKELFDKIGVDASRNATNSVSASRTRDWPRGAELQLKQLQDPMKEEPAVTERLKPESAATDSSSAEARRRIRQLERDVRGSGIKSSRPSHTGLFKAMCSTDLLFLIDTTASMMSHINAAKTQVRSIVDAITEACNQRTALLHIRDVLILLY
jgi:hypothetical protein